MNKTKKFKYKGFNIILEKVTKHGYSQVFATINGIDRDGDRIHKHDIIADTLGEAEYIVKGLITDEYK